MFFWMFILNTPFFGETMKNPCQTCTLRPPKNEKCKFAKQCKKYKHYQRIEFLKVLRELDPFKSEEEMPEEDEI